MKNEYKVKGDYTIIFIQSKGKTFECIVDTEDIDKLSNYRWGMHPKGYVLHKNNVTNYIHRIITSCPTGLFVDHINRNKLDNRKSNLRIVNNKQNSQNRALLPSNKTGYRGVCFEKFTGKYRVQFIIDGKTMDFGRYDDIHIAGYVSHQIIKNFMPYANLEGGDD